MPASLPRRALVSVSDKTGLIPFVAGLVELGFEILSTGGTRRALQEQDLPVIDVADYTGFPEIMDGRVKTLHPKIHGAVLGRPDLETDRQAMAAHGIVPFELVVCNLYPFEATITREGVTVAEAIEQIDIGGPSMIRSAAKNHAYIGVVTRADQYDMVLAALKEGKLDQKQRRELAAAAFEMTAQYDRAIANYMEKITTDEKTDSSFSATLSLQYNRRATLRYGENPHQQAAFFVESNPAVATLATTEQLHGKELSYNNLLDVDAAIELIREFSAPAAVVLKHNNPCGAAIGETLAAAFEAAYAGDPVSAFGSIIGFNRPLDLATAEQLCDPGRFVEAIVAPGFDDDAFEALTTRPKWKANVRLMRCPTLADERPTSMVLRAVGGGVLVQTRDDEAESPADWKVVTDREPTAEERTTLEFAWKICKHVKSNAIVFAQNGAVVGVGAGQMSRLDSAFIAAHKSAGPAKA